MIVGLQRPRHCFLELYHNYRVRQLIRVVISLASKTENWLAIASSSRINERFGPKMVLNDFGEKETVQNSPNFFPQIFVSSYITYVTFRC